MPQSLTATLFSPRTLPDQQESQSPFRSPYPFEWMDGVVLVLYACILFWTAAHHRPWIDEAQAWLIARDATVRELLLRRLHYEGAPALWHLILKAAISLHLPYAAFNCFAGLFGFLGVFVLVRFSPFPRIFRWLLPFTFYLQYQYAVVARPYVLYPFFLFSLCVVYSLRKPRPVLFGLVAGLLANINAHAGILSCMFALLYLLERVQAHDLTVPRMRRQLAAATGVFVLLCAASVLVAFPAPDAMVIPTATGRVKKANPVLVKLIPPERMPAGAPPLDPSLDQIAGLRAANKLPVSSVPPPPPPPQPKHSLLYRAEHRFLGLATITADVATFPLAEWNVLSVLFLVAFAVWLWSRRSLKFLVPWLVTVPAAAYIWVYDHHTGIFGLALVAAAWLALRRPVTPRGPQAISGLVTVLALVVIVLQIGWTAHAVVGERRVPYDAGKQTEAFLVEHYPGKRIAGFSFQTVSLEPYADHNLFENWDYTYWLWSNANPIDLRRTEALQHHPDVVVIGDLIQEQDSLYNQWHEDAPPGYRPYDELIRFWEEHGYHETHRFCGTRYMRAGADNSLCEVTFEPNGS